MRRAVAAVLLIAWLRTPVTAEPRPADPSPHDPNGRVRASSGSPWLDEAGAFAIEEPGGVPARDHKLAATLTLGGLYAGFTTWTYFAWYRNHEKKTPELCAEHHGDYRFGLCFGGDGWFGVTTYAGGADKLGHAWATMGLARASTELLHQWGGYTRPTAALLSCALAELLFIGVEVKDGAYYEFSYSDLVGDSLGVVAAFALSAWPRLDDLVDFRVQYWPSAAYVDQLTHDGNLNIAEDYSGQTYLVALHLGALRAVRDAPLGRWTRFVDVAVGFETRGYKPDHLPGNPDFPHTQRLFLGLTIDAQRVFDVLLDRRAPTARKLTHGVFEMFNLPYATLPVVDGTRGTLHADPGGA